MARERIGEITHIPPDLHPPHLSKLGVLLRHSSYNNINRVDKKSTTSTPLFYDSLKGFQSLISHRLDA